MMDVRGQIETYLGNYLAGYPVQDHADQMAQDIWDIDINGITLGELIEKRDRLVELQEDQTPPVSYWKHGVEIPIAPEVSGRYFEHVWMKVKGLAPEYVEDEDEIMYNQVEDSGKRQEFNTGSVRDTREGKGRYDLLPPEAIYRLAVHFANGAVKYGDRNWEKGQPLSRYLDSAIRHLFRYLSGSRVEDHLAAAAWNALCCIQTEHWINEGKLPKELDDMNVVEVQSRAGPIRMAADESYYKWIESSWVCVPEKPRTLWQRFLARMGLEG